MSPIPIAAAVLAELAGAEGIIAHLREDRRHIQDRDLRLLRADRADQAEHGDGGHRRDAADRARSQAGHHDACSGEAGGADDRGRARGRLAHRFMKEYIGRLQAGRHHASASLSILMKTRSRHRRKPGRTGSRSIPALMRMRRPEKDREREFDEDRRSGKARCKPGAAGGRGPRPELCERGEDRRYPRGGGTEHRPQHHFPGVACGDGPGGAGNDKTITTK